MAIHFSIERNGHVCSSRADGGSPFFVGCQTSYHDKSSGEDFEGLYNVPRRELPKLNYRASDYRAMYKFWADFIEPTSKCEGGNFLTLNTYDRARFTWGFGQFGAHIPDGDFVRFFRDLIGRPENGDYFPDLAVKDGRIVKVTGAASLPMETATSTAPLMDYLNPTVSSVEDTEVVAAAKLIHWATNVEQARDLQVMHMIAVFKSSMRDSDTRLGLDGRGADICLAICDIRHQGRARMPAIQAALSSSRPLNNLLALGSIAYPERCATLKDEIAAKGSLLTSMRWNRQRGDFV
ncbi:hypothetical protein QMZ05_05065 [Bradyrhizobium sp. INPA03-11B]|uniref:hypothetical protein n=1 Tax=Bradyrhizobium sp. INPA03-11B TaxID=418598 RepID=UPI0033906D6A